MPHTHTPHTYNTAHTHYTYTTHITCTDTTPPLDIHTHNTTHHTLKLAHHNIHHTHAHNMYTTHTTQHAHTSHILTTHHTPITPMTHHIRSPPNTHITPNKALCELTPTDWLINRSEQWKQGLALHVPLERTSQYFQLFSFFLSLFNIFILKYRFLERHAHNPGWSLGGSGCLGAQAGWAVPAENNRGVWGEQ